MGLDVVIRNALTGVQTLQQALSVHSQNVANANTPNYIKRGYNQTSITTDGVGQGTKIESVTANFDQRLFNLIRGKTSDLEKATNTADLLNSIQQLFGDPNEGGLINSNLNAVFTSLTTLAVNPDVASSRLDAEQSLANFAGNIRKIATDLQQQRFQAEQNVSQTFDAINTTLAALYKINVATSQFLDNSNGRNDLIEQRESKLRDLAGLMDFQSFTNEDDQVYITAPNGTPLLDPSVLYEIDYSPAASVDSFVNENILSPARIYRLNDDGSRAENPATLIAASASNETTSSISGGKIKALLDVRDVIIPEFLEHLDNFAEIVGNSFNAIHNEGTSFPPPSSLTGTRPVKSTDTFGFSGSIRISVNNEDGSPVASTYSDETYLRPLELDLSTLNSGDGAGQITMSDIVNEINAYYGPPQNRVSLGNLRDIKIAAVSDSIDATGDSFTFDLDLDNISALSSTLAVTSVQVLDPSDDSVVSTVAGGSLPTDYTIASGGQERTGGNITVDLSPSNLSSYTIRIGFEVTDEEGNVSTSSVDYTVIPDVTDIRNNRYTAQAVESGDATLYTPTSSQRYLTASIVDANGNAVSAGTTGFLKITANRDTTGIAIDSLDSAETGITGAATADITNRGFSHYFELNNLFVRNATTAGTAYNFDIRSDIKANPNKLAVGTLSLSNQPTDTTQALFTYELAKGNGLNAQALNMLSQQTVRFPQAGSLPASTITLGAYAADVISAVGKKSTSADQTESIETLTMNGLKDLARKASSVNTDEEMAKFVDIEQKFQANAQLFRLAREIMDQLMSSFN